MAENEGSYLKDFLRISAIASPGFSFSRLGVVQNSWLSFEGVPSNQTGAPMHFTDAVVLGYVIATSKIDTYDVEIYEHDTSTFTLLSTLNIVSKDFEKKILASPVSLTTDKRLGAKISSVAPNTATDPSLLLLVRGDLPT